MERGNKIVDFNLHRASAPTLRDARASRIVNIVGSKLLLPTAILAVVFAAAGHAEDTNATSVSPKELQAKLAYCETCHGPAGQGFVGYYPIPRLAGQQVVYLDNQLKGFMEGKRVNPIMFNVAHVLSQAMQAALATSLQALNPKPVGGGPKTLIASGKDIYEKGIPDANVLPCASCHGPEAKGAGQFPRLAGQLYSYTTKQLTNWSKERGENTSNIMAPIARSLAKPQIEAVAAYLSYLE